MLMKQHSKCLERVNIWIRLDLTGKEVNILAYHEKQEIRVLFVMLKELKRSRKSPVLCASLPSFCSSSSSGISFLLKAATFSSSFQACSDLFFTKSQRADSGMNLRELITLKETTKVTIEI